MIPAKIKTQYLNSPLRRLGYSFAKAMAAPAIRACLEARAKAAERHNTKENQQQELGL